MRGRVIAWREMKNPHTTSDLILIDVDAGKVRLEVLVNRADIKGELKVDGWLSAEVWLQGHILSEKELQARYEGLIGTFIAAVFGKHCGVKFSLAQVGTICQIVPPIISQSLRRESKSMTTRRQSPTRSRPAPAA